MKNVKKIITGCTIIILLVNIFLPTVIYASQETNDLKNTTIIQEDLKNNEEKVDENIKNEESSGKDVDSNDLSNDKQEGTTNKQENILQNEEVIEDDMQKENTEEERVENEITSIQTYSNLIIEDGIYVIRSAVDKNMVLDISEGSNKVEANLQLWTYDNQVNQQRFKITSNGNGYYTIQAIHSKKVLDVADASKANGTNVRQYDSNATDAQQWKILDLGNGQVSFVSKCNGLYLDIADGKIQKGANIQVYEGNETDAQKFILERNEYKSEKTIEDGIYTIKSKLDTNKVIDVSEGSLDNSANIQIWQDENVNQQKFKITYHEEGYYKIEAKHSKKVFDVENGAMVSGANVQQYEWNNSDAQKWTIEKNSDGTYSFRSILNGYYLNLAEGSSTKGTNVQVYTKNNSDAQKFILEKNEYKSEKTIEDGIYIIKSKLDTNKVIDVSEGSMNNSANIQIWQNEEASQQRFKISYHEEGYYKIEAMHSKKVLDIENGSMINGANVQQYEWNDSDAQKWAIEKNTDGTYSVRSILNGYYLDIEDGKSAKGTNVQVYAKNSSNAQKFILESECKQTIKDGIYKINTKLNANMYLNGSGSNVNIVTNEISDAQRFYVKYQGDGYYILQLVSDDRVIELPNTNASSGTNIQLSTYKNSETQKWVIKDAGDGYYYIKTGVNLLCMDVSDGKAKDNQKMQIYESNCTDSQKFKFVNVEEAEGKQTIKDGIYNIATVLDTNYVLDISEGSESNSANLQMWINDNVNQQKFLVEYQGGGYYRIQALHSGKVLDVEGGTNRNGTNVAQYESNGTNAQRWMIKEAGNGEYYIVSKCNGLYLDVKDGKIKKGANVQVYEGNGSTAQKFKFLNPPLISNDTYRISTALNNKSVIDVSEGSMEDGANIQIWMSTNVPQQNFQVQYLEEGYYKITAQHSGLVLTVQNGNVVQSKYVGSDAQKWKIIDAGDNYYHIASKVDGRYLDVDNEQTANGTNVKVYKPNGSNAQKFKFENLALKGIDVSEWNGLINWEFVRRSGIEFAMIRIGYRGYGTEGNFKEDPYFRINMQGAKNAGLKVGVYFFTQAVNKEEAIEEANWVMNTLNQSGYTYQLDYPIAIDTEKSGAPNNSGRADNLDVPTRTIVCKAFCETIQQNGYTPMIYASRNWFYDNLNMNELNQFDIWLAQYNNVADYTGHYEIWQYTSKGTIPGVNGYVDFNIGYKRY